MNTRELGAKREAYACDYLTANGIRIVNRNYRTRRGEIDIIGYDGDTLVFFEVKYRSSGARGYAAEAVDYRKQYRICRVSDYYRMVNHLPIDSPCRYDVIAMDGEDITWIKNAFDYIWMRS